MSSNTKSDEYLEFYDKAITVLSDNIMLGIAKQLNHKDLSFSELRKTTILNKEALYNRIKDLIKSGIVTNYYQKRKDTSEYSFYQLSEFGKDVLSKVKG